mgnify:CR=1 FL=1
MAVGMMRLTTATMGENTSNKRDRINIHVHRLLFMETIPLAQISCTMGSTFCINGSSTLPIMRFFPNPKFCAISSFQIGVLFQRGFGRQSENKMNLVARRVPFENTRIDQILSGTREIRDCPVVRQRSAQDSGPRTRKQRRCIPEYAHLNPSYPPLKRSAV